MPSHEALCLLFALQGGGRAMWESTNKALVADLFVEETDAAFANGNIQLGLASALGFFAFPRVPIRAAASIGIVTAVLSIGGLVEVARHKSARRDSR